MKKFQNPEFDVVKFNVEDIITTSDSTFTEKDEF